MKNTPYAISESSSLVAKLLARTEEGKIEWTEGGFIHTGLETFDAALEGDLKVSISSDKEGVAFDVRLTNRIGDERRILYVSLEHDPSFGYDLPGESELYESLIQLHELARRSALKVDQSLANARDFLERLAS
jgi:hypothetical protein